MSDKLCSVDSEVETEHCSTEVWEMFVCVAKNYCSSGFVAN